MSQWKAFKGILHRDLLVFFRNLRGNSVRIFVQPTFFLVLFGIIMPKMGLFQQGYSDILIPGILTISAMTASSFGVGALVGLSFFRNKEIWAHLLAPISLPLFVVEKITYGIFQALLSAIIMLGVSFVIFPGTLTFPSPVPFLVIIVLTSIIFSSLGIAIGSRFRRPPILFEVLQLVIMPLIFFGATFFPLSSVKEISPVFYVVLHLLPNVYTSEGLRALITPHIEHLPLQYTFIGLVLWSVPMFFIGLREFRKRAIS